MVLQQPWVFLILIYWLLCLLMFKRSASKLPFTHIGRLGKKVFVAVLTLFVSACLFYRGAETAGDNHLFLGVAFYLLAIFFDVTATALFVWYGFKGGGLVLAFPLLLLRHGYAGAEKFVEEIMNRRKGQ